MTVKHTADMEKDKFDADGKVKIVESLSSDEVTALGSSTDINKWMQAYKNGQLLKKYVNSYDDEDEQEVYYTHPDLGNGYKSLKLVYGYSTENSQQVVKSITPSVADWSFDSGATATVTITLGSVTSPNPSSAIAVGTDVISSITITNSGGGTNTLSLSGVDASKYQLNNTTTATTGSSVTAAVTDTVVIETATDYSGASYTHNVTCTITESLYGATDSESFVVSGTYSAYSNKEYMKGVPVWYYEGVYGRTSGGGLLSPNSTFNDYSTNPQTYNFWIKLPSTIGSEIVIAGDEANNQGIFIASSSIYGDLYLYTNSNVTYRYSGYNFPTNQLGKWLMITFVTDATQVNTKMYVQDSITFNSTPVTLNVTNGSSGANWAQPSSSTTIASTGFFGCRTFSNTKFPTTASGMTTTNYEIDEWTSWNKALSATEIEELHNNHNPYDYSTHSAASDMYHWIRFGDKSGDTESSISCNVHADFTLAKNTNATGTYLTDLTYLDTPYVAASGELAQDYFVNTGADKYIKEGISQQLQNSFSISFWYKSDSFTAGGLDAHYFGIVDNANTHSYSGYQRQNGLFVSLRGASAFVNISGSTYGGIYYELTGEAVTVDNGNWRHVALVWTAPSPAVGGNISLTTLAAQMRLYVDGVAATFGSSTGGTADISDTDTFNELRIGDFVSSSTELAFSVDELAYFDYALSAGSGSDIEKIYNNGTPTDLENTTGLTAPVRYLRFENGSDLAEEEINNSTSTATTNCTQASY